MDDGLEGLTVSWPEIAAEFDDDFQGGGAPVFGRHEDGTLAVLVGDVDQVAGFENAESLCCVDCRILIEKSILYCLAVFGHFSPAPVKTDRAVRIH